MVCDKQGQVSENPNVNPPVPRSRVGKLLGPDCPWLWFQAYFLLGCPAEMEGGRLAGSWYGLLYMKALLKCPTHFQANFGNSFVIFFHNVLFLFIYGTFPLWL